MYRSSCTEFLRSFIPLLYVLKISGLLTNEIREVNGNLITRRSPFGIIETVIYIVTYSGIIYFMEKNDIVIHRLAGVSMLIENVQLFTLELIFYIVLLSAIIGQKGFLRIIRSISKLDTLLFQLGEEIDYRKEFKRHMILVGSFYTTIIGNSMIQFFIHYRPGFGYILHTFLWFPATVVMHSTLLQFAIMVFSLKLRCSKLNNAVLKMIEFTNERNLNGILNLEIEYQSSQMHYCSYNIGVIMRNLSVAYDIICEICKTINKVFSLQVTVIFGAESAFLTFLIYRIATFIKYTTYPCEWETLAVRIESALLHVISIFGVIYCCSGAKSEADQVAILLHRVKPKGVKHREAINTFSLQSMHQKVEFTACGLFNLDYTFIYLLISTISTYIVILVQFG